MALMAFGKFSFVAAALLLVLFATVLKVESKENAVDDDGWRTFKERFGKKYEDTMEDQLRRAIRQMNLKEIKSHNQAASEGLHSFTLAENDLIDLTPSEFRKMLGYKAATTSRSHRRRRQASQPPMPVYDNTISVSTLPVTVNWTTSGWVGPVMDQGQCGSCWAYSAVGAIEAQYINHTGNWVQLSEQNLIDCSSPEGNLGCDGGNIDDAFWYVQTNGLESLASYPDVSNITGVSNSACAFNPTESVTTVTSWRNVASENELALQQAVALAGPVSVAIDASLSSFQMYSGGVYAPTDCLSADQDLDHAVLVIGYGVSGTQDYWLIQNSWGTSWGINGYMMMARNDNNMCGIATAASFPVIG